MYCPSCGSEERQLSQFCRGCGTDLRAVRTTLERPDPITASAVSAREQISRVMADKIAEMESSHDLKQVAEDVLPQIEKFLESPEERRLRRVRAGVIVAAVGLGATVVTLIMALNKGDVLPFASLGFITFLVGLGLIINGLAFTLPRKEGPSLSREPDPQLLSQQTGTSPISIPTLLSRPTSTPSVTEHTTQHLGNKPLP